MKKKPLLVAIAGLVALAILAFWSVRTAAPSYTRNSSGTNSSATDGPPDNPAPSFDKAKYSTSDPTSLWVVINKQHALNPKTYTPADLVAVGNGQFMRAEAATALTAFFAGAKTAGYTLTADSGYRSYDTQVKVYGNEVKVNGQATADTQSARPGYSEHQTGWVMDIGGSGCHVNDCFGTTDAGKWAAANAYKYGFLLRYQPGNTTVTGYRAESWHFRYVGTDLSNELKNKNITTLEEFFGVTGGPNY